MDMAKKDSGADTGIASPSGNGSGNGPSNGASGASAGDGLTGRYIVAFKEGASTAGAELLERKVGVRAQSVRALGGELERGAHADLLLDEIGAAVFSAAPDQRSRMLSVAAESDSPILIIEPERVVYAITMVNALTPNGASRAGYGGPSPFDLNDGALLEPAAARAQGALAPALSVEFLKGYRAAIDGLLSSVTARAPLETGVVSATSPGAIWALEMTGALASRFSGAGIKVAILDTGMDLNHPDFAGRAVVTQSFVPGEEVQDGHGHGTHCIGTACGPQRPPILPRYGVAHGAAIFAGKVLSNAGRGADGGILEGINWAVGQGCHVISMSLGSPVAPGQSFSAVYETVARRAEQRGTVIVAAAGNDSRRPGQVQPVAHPANCPSIVAVGALDVSQTAAFFSNGGINPSGGEVNVAAPGLDIYSTWPMPQRYHTISGTSMATPHVAGILALYAESSGLRGFALVNAMLRRSRSLTPARDFGWGLVQAT